MHLLAAADNRQIVVFALQVRLVGDDLPHVPRRFERRNNELLKLGHLKRLEQIIIRAELHRFDGCLRSSVSSHHDHRQPGIGLTQPPQRLQAIDAAHAHVHDDQVRLEPGNEF